MSFPVNLFSHAFMSCVCVLKKCLDREWNLIYVCYVLCSNNVKNLPPKRVLFVAVCWEAKIISCKIAEIHLKLEWNNVRFKGIRAITKFLITFLPFESCFVVYEGKMLRKYSVFDDKSLPFWYRCVDLYSSAFLSLQWKGKMSSISSHTTNGSSKRNKKKDLCDLNETM